MSDLVGQQIKHYRIDALIGEGGMGAVYRAYDLKLARAVALKMMHRQLAGQSQFQQRFMQEAQAVARLNNPSIVVVHDFDSRDGEFFIVMELVPGISLGTYIKELIERQQVITLGETSHIIAQVADALDYAHREGVIHRDIKPDNILVKPLKRPERPQEPPLRAMVTDFGLAKLLEGGIETATGTFMGTMPYMSPEQALAKPVDGRSDLYSVGVVLYQLATGQLPFDIQSPTDAVMKHLHETPTEPRQIQPGLPLALEQVIVRSLAKQPEERFQTGEEMAGALRQAGSQLTDKDVTSFVTASDRAVVSLVTRLAEPTSAPKPDLDTPKPIRRARLFVTRKGATSLTYQLEKPVLTIGRTMDNAITLPDDKISRRHAQLRQTETGWQITDLNSTNGTFLDNIRLLPRVPEEWQKNTPLRIGDFWLRLEEDSPLPDSLPVIVRSDGTAVAIEEIHASPGTNVGVHLVAPECTVAPGGKAAFPLIILNQGDLVDHFSVKVAGLPESWLSGADSAIHLMPGGQKEETVFVQPPHSPESRAGSHPFQIQVTGKTASEDVAEVEGNLIITPYFDFQLDLRPQKLTSAESGEFTINIQNRSNADLILQFTAVDIEDACSFTFEPATLTVPVAEKASAGMIVNAKAKPSANKTHIFTITAHGDEADRTQRQIQGTWEQTPALESKPQEMPDPPPPAVLPEPPPKESFPPEKPTSLPESIAAEKVDRNPVAGCAVFVFGLVVTAAIGWGIGAGSYEVLPRDIADGGSLVLASVIWLGGIIYSIKWARKVWQRR